MQKSDLSYRSPFKSYTEKFNFFLGFEMIRGCVIETEPFSVENELLTPTQKAKRPVIQAKYKEALEELYKNWKKSLKLQ